MKNNQTKFAGVAIAALLAIIGFTPVANAQLITLAAGNFTINANGYSASTIFAQAPGALPTTSAGGGGTLEDTWGIFQITSILDGATTVFDDNNGTEYWGMFYNSYDTSATPFGSNVFFTSQGLQLDIYEVTVLDTADAAFGLVFNQGTGGRIDLDEFNLLTNAGTLVLSSTLSGQMDGAFFGNTQTTSSNGNLAVTYNNMFDVGLLSLSELTFALSGLTSSVPADWTVKFDGPIDGHLVAVPEPSTYGLMGAVALMGLVAIRRMKKRGQAV